jgi:hypothetical protein
MDTEKKPDENTEKPKQDMGEVISDLIVSGATVLAHTAAEAVVGRVKKAAAKTAPVKAAAKAVKRYILRAVRSVFNDEKKLSIAAFAAGLLREGVDVRFGFVAKHRGIWPAKVRASFLASDRTYVGCSSFLRWVDRRQLTAFGSDVPEGPTQVDCFLKVSAVKRVAFVGHSGKSSHLCYG